MKIHIRPTSKADDTKIPRVLYLSLLLIAVTGICQPAIAQTVKFNPPVNNPAGKPFVVSAGDFNGDGKIDLVAGDISNDDIVMLLGNGDGSLKAPATYHQSVHPHYLTVSDFNRDGKLDLVFADGSPGHISFLKGNGDGTFEPAVSYPVVGIQVLAADFNNDGKPDLLTRT